MGDDLSQEPDDDFFSKGSGRDGSAIINETPDTVILTNNRATDDSQSTQTQDTVLLTRNQTLSEDDQTQGDGVLNEDQDEKCADEPKDTASPAEPVERAQPGFMEEDCGFLMLSSDDDEGSKSDRKKVLKKKKAKKLVLSDDSGDEETDRVSVKSDKKEGSIKDTEGNDDGKVVMYDSEENEVTM